MWTPPFGFLKELARFTISYFSPPLVRISNVEFGTLPDYLSMQGISCALQFINETEKAVLVRSITLTHESIAAETLQTLRHRVFTQHGMAVASLRPDEAAVPPFKVPGMDSITRYAIFRFNKPVDAGKLPLHFSILVEYAGRKSHTLMFEVGKL